MADMTGATTAVCGRCGQDLAQVISNGIVDDGFSDPMDGWDGERSPEAVVRGPEITADRVGVNRATLFSRPVLTLLAVVAGIHLLAVVVGLERSPDLFGFLTVAASVMRLVIPVPFIAWFYRAYKNLESFGFTYRHNPGWAIGAWVFPFLNFVRPKEMANDLWRASDPTRSKRDPIDKRVHPVIDAWWAFWLVSEILIRVADTLTQDAETAEEFLDTSRWWTLRSIAAATAAILCFLMVRMTMARQQARLAASEQVTQPTPA